MTTDAEKTESAEAFTVCRARVKVTLLEVVEEDTDLGAGPAAEVTIRTSLGMARFLSGLIDSPRVVSVDVAPADGEGGRERA